MAKYTNSSLATVKIPSPNVNKTRVHARYNPKGVIDRIVIHHMAGNLTVETCGNMFAKKSRRASSTYGIGTDGRIGQYADEAYRPWTTSNAATDYKAITIEVANDGGSPNWHVSDKALKSLIKLCVDICKRNNIKKLNYTGDKSGNLLMHKWFSATDCPGPYLGSKFPYIASEVNKLLGANSISSSASSSSSAVKKNDLVSIKSGAKYYNGKTIPSWVTKDKWYVSDVSGDRAVLGKNESGNNNIQSPINVKYLTVVKSSSSSKSSKIKELDKVKLSSSAVIYGTNKKFQDWVYKSTLYVREIDGKRVVISTQKTGAITGAVDIKYLAKV